MSATAMEVTVQVGVMDGAATVGTVAGITAPAGDCRLGKIGGHHEELNPSRFGDTLRLYRTNLGIVQL